MASMSTELEKAARACRRAEAAYERCRAELARTVLAALEAGVTQTEIAKATGYTRETIRRIQLKARKQS